MFLKKAIEWEVEMVESMKTRGDCSLAKEMWIHSGVMMRVPNIMNSTVISEELILDRNINRLRIWTLDTILIGISTNLNW